MQLSEAKLVRPMNQDRISTWDVDTSFNDCGADQDVVTLVIEIGHHLFQCPLCHLTMSNANPCLRHNLLDMLCGSVDRFHFIV